MSRHKLFSQRGLHLCPCFNSKISIAPSRKNQLIPSIDHIVLKPNSIYLQETFGNQTPPPFSSPIPGKRLDHCFHENMESSSSNYQESLLEICLTTRKHMLYIYCIRRTFVVKCPLRRNNLKNQIDVIRWS